VRSPKRIDSTVLRAAVLCATLLTGQAHLQAQSPYARWDNGPSTDPGYFPIGVWLQSTSPSRVAQYQAIGVNLYVGLWRGPTESQLANLKTAGMQCICSQNTVGLTSPNRDVIVGWAQQDEPDNAQAASGGGYDPPILPSVIAARYQTMVAADDTRPVFLNFGQGVAWDGWVGRGVRTNHPEDYPLYIVGDPDAEPPYGPGCDIASFDIYPCASSRAEVKDKIWLVAFGVDRLISWSDNETQTVWNFVECTDIHGDGKATPTQVKAEVWMSIIHGSMGILYFVHQIDPFIEPGLLQDAEMTAAVSAINWRIRSLAPVLNSPTVVDGAAVQSSSPEVPVDIMVKHHDEDAYLFAVGMRDGATTATFQLADFPGSAEAEVIGEDRTVPVAGGAFQDTFSPYAVHLYRIPLPQAARVAAWEVATDHSAAGPYAAPAVDSYVEPRIDGLRRVRITFDQPLDPATVNGAAVAVEAMSNPGLLPGHTVSLDITQTVMIVAFDGPLTDRDVYTLTVAGSVQGADGQPVTGDLDITLRTLAGDVDGSGAVTAADILAARAAAGQPLGPGTCRWDVTTSGAVTGDDLLAIRRRLGNALP